MKFRPCKVTYEGRQYHIACDGTVYPTQPVDVGFAGSAEPVSAEFAKIIRAHVSRLRRNRAARERHDVMRSLGLVKTPYGWE